MALFLIAAVHGAPITDAQRIAAKAAIERARYVFVIGDKPPFETRYPKPFFQKQLKDEQQREAILRRVFGVTIKRTDLAGEYKRIEKSTRAPEQWDAVKSAVKHNRRMIEEVVCRPLLVDRALRVKFDFDQKIHAEPHEAARRARADLLAGRKPAAADVQVISRSPANGESVDAMMQQAQADNSVPRAMKPGSPRPETGGPLLMEPEALKVLEKELHKPRDVSTILEYRDRFEVYRLLEATPSFWKVELVRFPKKDFDSWYENERSAARK